MIEFPAGLPTPLVAGYGVTMASGRARTGFSAGNVRVRTVTADGPQVVGASWMLTRAEGATLEAFHRARRGRRFVLALRTPGDPRRVRGVVARFSGPLTFAAVSQDHQRVSASLIVDYTEIVTDAGELVASDGAALGLQWETLA